LELGFETVGSRFDLTKTRDGIDRQQADTHAAGTILAVQNELAEIGTEVKLLTATD
jgi:hypothetical protein